MIGLLGGRDCATRPEGVDSSREAGVFTRAAGYRVVQMRLPPEHAPQVRRRTGPGRCMLWKKEVKDGQVASTTCLRLRQRKSQMQARRSLVLVEHEPDKGCPNNTPALQPARGPCRPALARGPTTRDRPHNSILRSSLPLPSCSP